MSNDVMVKEENKIIYHDYDLLNIDLDFNTKIDIATNVANSLSKVIDEQEMYITLGDNKHVLIDGWETLGTMLGLIAITKDVIPAPEELINTTRKREKVIAYLAEVDIIDKNGTTIGNGKQIATNLEKGKEHFDHYAIYGMATTRAKGRAYRNCLGWIMKLAGYSGTPAEEMDNIKPKMNQNKKAKKAKDEPNEVLDAEYTKKEKENKKESEKAPKLSALSPEQIKTISQNQVANQAINVLYDTENEINKRNLVNCVQDMLGQQLITPEESSEARKLIMMYS